MSRCVRINIAIERPKRVHLPTSAIVTSRSVLPRKRTSSARTVEQIPQRRADVEEHLVRQTAGIGDLYLGRIDIEVGGGALIKQCRRWAPLSSAKRQI